MENFAFAQIDVSERDPSLNELFRSVKPFWAPLFRASSSRGVELRRWFGFFPPEELRLELEIVLAHDLMLQKKDSEAVNRLEEALARSPSLRVAPEAMFWMGVAAFKAGGRDFDALESAWNELIARWPDSTWASRADVMDMMDA